MTTHTSPRPKILLADDEQDLLMLLSDTLAEGPWDILLARDGEEALHLARTHRPNLILLDALMPRRTGFDVCRLLKADPATAGIRIIILTGLATEAERQKALNAGADDFIAKPFSPLALLDLVRSSVPSPGPDATPPLAPAPSVAQADPPLFFDRMGRRQLEIYARELAAKYREASRLRAELEQENQARARFLNVLCHELRTPLTPILASTGMLKETLRFEPNSQPARLLDNILSGIEVLRARIDDLLDAAALQAGQYRLELAPLDMGPLLQSVYDLMRPEALRRKQRLELDAQPHLPHVMGDSRRLHQVLCNLVTNALKFSPERALITLRAFARDASLIIEVQDEGRGLTPDEQARLFEPYFRAAQGADRLPGLGLGLPVARQIIEAHQGHITVASKPGKGSTFRISLPLAS